jgi:hypothetical protein
MHRTAIIVLGIIVLTQLSMHPEVRREVTVVVQPPLVVPMPMAQPQPQPQPIVDVRDPLGPCPAPYRRTTDIEIADVPNLDIEGITASAYDTRLLAAWDQHVVMLSLDEGRTWRDGPASEDHAVADALFDCHGRLRVLFGTGELATFDDGTPEEETWQTIATFADSTDRGRLVIDGGGVAAIGPDPATRDALLLARRDARGRWRSVPLAEDTESGSWDGIEIQAIESLGKDRFRMLAMPWYGGECGYAHYLDIRFDLDARHVSVKQLGEDLPERSHWRAPEIDGVLMRVRDAAGRWINVADDPNASSQLTRAN